MHLHMGMLDQHLFAKRNKISPLTRKLCKGASFCAAQSPITAATFPKDSGCSLNSSSQKQKSPATHWSSGRFYAVRTGLEPVTPCVTGMYSNQLN